MLIRGTVGQRLKTFVSKYTGMYAVGDTPGNIGQCVGLVEVWTDYLDLPHTWGNAKDLLDQADPAKFKVVRNTPTNFPVPGDVVVFGSTWGAGFGHTGVAVTGHIMDMVLFQQNDPDGSTPHLKTYGYSGVLGWLHPLVTS